MVVPLSLRVTTFTPSSFPTLHRQCETGFRPVRSCRRYPPHTHARAIFFFFFLLLLLFGIYTRAAFGLFFLSLLVATGPVLSRLPLTGKDSERVCVCALLILTLSSGAKCLLVWIVLTFLCVCVWASVCVCFTAKHSTTDRPNDRPTKEY